MFQRLRVLLQQVGDRYRGAKLETFEATCGDQRRVLATVRAYAAEIDRACDTGRNLVLYGPPGTGKDHLGVGVLVKAIGAGKKVAAVDGLRLFQASRDAIAAGTAESDWMAPYLGADVLLLSDPVPPLEFSGPREHQLSILWRIVDDRYRRMRPTIVTANVEGREELTRRLSPSIVDRLIDGSVAAPCKWPSHREQRMRDAKANQTKETTR